MNTVKANQRGVWHLFADLAVVLIGAIHARQGVQTVQSPALTQ